jgi:ferritin-like metal-binding protein YciE
MSRYEQTVLQHLDEARASERANARVLESQISMTPEGRFRSALESHLDETRDQASRLERRMRELGWGRDPVRAIIGLAESAVGQLVALGKLPLDLIRGNGGEPSALRNAKDAAATEAWEMAAYTALEHLARALGDDATATLAASIREQEERMYRRVLREIPRLTAAIVRAEATGNGSRGLAGTGPADGGRRVGSSGAKQSSGAVEMKTRRAARRASGVARSRGQLRGLMASTDELPIANYDRLTAGEVIEQLPALAQIDLAKVGAYERRGEKRTTVISRIGALERQEPWPGYDELTAHEVRDRLGDVDEETARRVYDYERPHKNRSVVLEAAARERAHA